MKKISNRRELRKLNKLSYMAIILFLVLSMGYYQEVGDTKLVGKIALGILLFSLSGIKNIISSAGGMSDGIDIGLD